MGQRLKCCVVCIMRAGTVRLFGVSTALMVSCWNLHRHWRARVALNSVGQGWLGIFEVQLAAVTLPQCSRSSLAVLCCLFLGLCHIAPCGALHPSRPRTLGHYLPALLSLIPVSTQLARHGASLHFCQQSLQSELHPRIAMLALSKGVWVPQGVVQRACTECGGRCQGCESRP